MLKKCLQTFVLEVATGYPCGMCRWVNHQSVRIECPDEWVKAHLEAPTSINRSYIKEKRRGGNFAPPTLEMCKRTVRPIWPTVRAYIL